MMKSYVHFDPETGEIRQVSASEVPFEFAGSTIAEMNMSYVEVRDAGWKVDLSSIVERPGDAPSCTLVRVV